MKNKTYILLLILLFMGCSEHSLPSEPTKNNKETTDFTFSVFIPEEERVDTRSVESIRNLQLLVFDENRRFISRHQAVLEGVASAGILNYKVTLVTSTTKRYIHFIANYTDWNSFPPSSELIDVDEGDIITKLNSSDVTYWNRRILNRIDESTFKGETVQLIRNKAKVSLNNEAAGFIVSEFSLYNTPARGTVATYEFNYESKILEFNYDIITEVEGVELLPPQRVNYNTQQSINLFNKNNREAVDKAFLIVKGAYGSNPESYYKIDFTNKEDEGLLYNFVRNHIYTVTIKKVETQGFSSEEEAASNPAINNIYTSIELKEYPIISDGKSVLEVDKISEVFVEQGIFETQIKYYPDITSPITDYSSVDVKLCGNDAYGYLSDLNYDKQTGRFSVKVNKVPTDRVLKYLIQVKANSSNPTVLIRYIYLTLRSPYDFNLVLTSEANKGQRGKVTISFEVPSLIADHLFPFDIYFTTKELFPDPLYKEMILDIKDKKIRYAYQIGKESRGQEVTLHFLRSSSNKTDTIKVSSRYIPDKILKLD